MPREKFLFLQTILRLMKNSRFLVILTMLFLVACGSPEKPASSDKDFDKWKNSFIEQYWKIYPGHASSVGFHKYDDILVIPNDVTRNTQIAFSKRMLKELERFDQTTLSAGNQTDFQIIENKLKGRIWEIQELKDWQWDPSGYNICGSFAEMLNNNYDSLDARLRNFSRRLLHVPAYYAAAAKNIQNPTREHTKLAISQNRGGVSVFTTDLPAALERSGLNSAEKDSLLARSDRAVKAIHGYADWLEQLKNDHPRDFRLGQALYKQKFAFEIQSASSPAQIYQKALKHKQQLHKDMIAIAHKIWNKHMGNRPKPGDDLVMVRQLIDTLSVHHVKPENFQAEIERQIPELEKFVNDHKLIYLDPKKPLVVRREPDYMAGVAGASISAPGPYDKNGNTYYNVGSLSGWTSEAQESYLREYNDYVLQILNIHEAVPGHYTQLVYSNQSPSLIKSLFGNGTMIEGWAVYTERMMLESGYGNDLPEMWLMYYKWNLRTTCNTILDYSVHNLGMSQQQALDLLTKEAFQQQAEAEGKWKRATLTQVQLCSYFTGYVEIIELRDELKKKQGNDFNLKQFHEKFLSFGSAPVKDIRKLILE